MSQYEVTATKLHVRSGPGLNFDVVDALDLGDVVEEFFSNDWCPIEAEDGSIIWASRQYLKPYSGPLEPPPPTPPPTPPPNPPPVDELTLCRQYKPFIVASASKREFPPEVIAGILSRESRFGLALDANGLGDAGHGHGLMQIDDRSWATWLGSANWMDPATNIDKGVEILSGGRTYLTYKGVLPANSNMALRAILAAYNCGEGAVLEVLKAGDDIDSRTTGKNYSADVLVRATRFKQVFAPLPDEPPWITWMKSKLGYREGINDEEINTWFQYTTLPKSEWNDRVTAWCAVTVNAALFINGKQGDRSALAVDFLKWGIEVDTPQIGDVVVYDWSLLGNRSGHHVNFFLVDAGPDFIKCIGGNQGSAGAVSLDTCPKAAVMGYRRPA